MIDGVLKSEESANQAREEKLVLVVDDIKNGFRDDIDREVSPCFPQVLLD